MHSRKTQQMEEYMIVYEFDYQGFILAFIKTSPDKIKIEVENRYNVLVDNTPSSKENEIIHEYKNAIAHYKIYGDKVFAGMHQFSISNGNDHIFAKKVSIKFDLETYIKERQNCRMLLDPFAGDEEDEKLTDFVLRFEYHTLYAN